MLFEELYKVTGFAVYFSNLWGQTKNYKQRLTGFYGKSLKSYKACSKEKIILH